MILDMLRHMKTISLSVSETDYETFRRAAQAQRRSIAQLIREAMAFYRKEKLIDRTPVLDVPVLPGHRLIGEFPTRAEIYDEIFAARERPLS
jgi:hypothetical protein